jgi:hypothetical protein
VQRRKNIENVEKKKLRKNVMEKEKDRIKR